MISRLRKAQEEREGGFTLIELLVVMIIIGILAAIAIPLFLSQRQKGYDASVKSDLHSIANEMESYYTDSQAYPSTFTTTATTIGPTTATIGTDTVRLSPNNLFQVTMNSSGTAYCIEGATFPAGTTTWGTNYVNSHPWFYVSDLGGLQASTATSCGSF